MKKIIQDFYRTYGDEKLVFNVINGGWEKVFQTEFGYSLLKNLIPKGGWVKIEDNNVDLCIYKHSSSDFIIETGHYFFNQPLQKLSNFKPFNDIVKRALQGHKSILHVMLVEGVSTNSSWGFKYPLPIPRGNNIQYYLNLYEAAGLNCFVLGKLGISELGYDVDSYIILSYPSVGGVKATTDIKDIIIAEGDNDIEVKFKKDENEFKFKITVNQGLEIIKILAGIGDPNFIIKGKKIKEGKVKVNEDAEFYVKDLVGKDLDGKRIEEILDLDKF